MMLQLLKKENHLLHINEFNVQKHIQLCKLHKQQNNLYCREKIFNTLFNKKIDYI